MSNDGWGEERTAATCAAMMRTKEPNRAYASGREAAS
eukprot:CAMPEP_0181182568 /NCGR_PEP_ID=MMETSP1096-20121128/7961_1 /TAXON_ID=156174 ORGANISM="Chrysochromulina ericina, Strain CCMP281" /NCGR_SAMPLE_ID=MMETSP1096 /ASSEMBLY_ACC=CAM_ASM_000453 /LENGTH=36 /DNA_ID= /DNA_START= /DNA_END= /DNA_ORIENTATION=